MHIVKILVTVTLLSVGGASLANPLAVEGPTLANPLDAKCEKLGEEWEQDNSWTYHEYFKVQAFYSPKLDACIHAIEPLISNRFEIHETSSTFLKDHDLLMRCGGNRDYSFSVKIDAVIQNSGVVSNLPHRVWADDGFGGLPDTDEKADPPFSMAKCQNLFDRWMKQLR